MPDYAAISSETVPKDLRSRLYDDLLALDPELVRVMVGDPFRPFEYLLELGVIRRHEIGLSLGVDERRQERYFLHAFPADDRFCHHAHPAVRREVVLAFRRQALGVLTIPNQIPIEDPRLRARGAAGRQEVSDAIETDLALVHFDC